MNYAENAKCSGQRGEARKCNLSENEHTKDPSLMTFKVSQDIKGKFFYSYGEGVLYAKAYRKA